MSFPPGTGRVPTRPPQTTSPTWLRRHAQTLRDYAMTLEANPGRQAHIRRQAAMAEVEADAAAGRVLGRAGRVA